MFQIPFGGEEKLDTVSGAQRPLHGPSGSGCLVGCAWQHGPPPGKARSSAGLGILMNGTNRTRAAAAALLVALVAVLVGVAAGPASAGVLEPKGKQIFFGVSDTGDPASFGEFSEAVSKHPAVIESFRAWGSEIRDSIQRWEIARARPMVHITTADPQTGAEILNLAQIANGAGDSFLIRLNKLFAEKQMRAYVRPLGEPNRCLNVYAALNAPGTRARPPTRPATTGAPSVAST